MIARTWRGWTKREDADAYFEYVKETGGRAARSTRGNLGFYVLRCDQGNRTEFVTMSLWESLDAIRAFAGDSLEVVFYPDDDRFLIDRETFVTHYEIAARRRAVANRRASSLLHERATSSPCVLAFSAGRSSVDCGRASV